MKLHDYLSLQLMDPHAGFGRRSLTVAWGLWALLTKPGTFPVEGQEEEVVMEVRSGMVRLFLSSLLMVTIGLGLGLASLLGGALLLTLLLTLPLWLPLLYSIAAVRAWKKSRHHARALTEARRRMEQRG